MAPGRVARRLGTTLDTRVGNPTGPDRHDFAKAGVPGRTQARPRIIRGFAARREYVHFNVPSCTNVGVGFACGATASFRTLKTRWSIGVDATKSV